MKWFRQGQRPDEGESEGEQKTRDRQGGGRRELYLPGAVADDTLTEGRGFVLLGGSQATGDVTQVSVDDEGRSYVETGGRKHLADVPDILPKDDQEVNRLDFQHHLLRFTLRGNFAAPVTQPASILDVGCGTGRWAIEMASLFPRANVIGLDIAPPASTMVAGEHVPENYLFMTGNVLEGLPFGDATFDFVHMRLLFTAIPAVRWPQVVRELARVTRRGGWVELVEGALARGGGTALDTINRWVLALGQARGLDLNIGPRVGALLQSAGLSQVVFREILLPLGRYGGRAGQMNATDTFALIEGVRPLVVAQGLTTEQEFNHLLSTARAEVDQPQRQSVRPFYLAYGQRGW